MTRTFGPADIERASASEVSQADLRNFVRDGRFNTPLEEPRAGKAREFPVYAVYEAVLLKRFSSYRVPLDKAKVWNRMILARIAAVGVAWVNQETGSQSGPRGSSSIQIILFRHDSDYPLLLTDSQGGTTLNSFFYGANVAFAGKSGPIDDFATIHLPSVISRINAELGLTPEEAGVAGPLTQDN